MKISICSNSSTGYRRTGNFHCSIFSQFRDLMYYVNILRFRDLGESFDTYII